MTHAQPQAPGASSYDVGPARVLLRPIATPLPLGMLAQAVASLSFAALQLHWIATDQSHTVAWSVLVLTIPLQLLAATMGYLGRDPVAGTGIALTAGGWAATALTTVLTPPGSANAGLGIILVAVAGTLLVPTAAGWSKLVAALVLLLSAARFAADGIYQLTAATPWQSVTGWTSVTLVAVSGYAALALELEASADRTILPVGRTGDGRIAQDGDLAAQVEGVAHEAGVGRVL